MSGKLPALSGPQLIKILKRDGWQEKGRATHGQALIKKLPNGQTIVTVIPTKSRSLPTGTFQAILKQTHLSRERLIELLGN